VANYKVPQSCGACPYKARFTTSTGWLLNARTSRKDASMYGITRDFSVGQKSTLRGELMVFE